MATTTSNGTGRGLSARPPRGYFSVLHRLLRGYGPLAVFAVMLLLIAWLVPTKVADTVETSSSNQASGAGTGTGTGAGTGGTPGQAGTDAQAGTAGQPGTAGGTAEGPAPGAAGGCPDRAEQIPGDPYSPPCVAFSGSNGGATSKGVTDTQVNVGFRVLNERGFQQTLAELAGATLVDTPETVRNTVTALAEYFNTRFQFYGRQINIQFYNGVGSNTRELLGEGVDKAVADATTVSDELGSFADMSATSEPYGDALTDRGVVALGVPYLSREWHSSRHPYAWSLATDCTILAENTARYTVARLQGNADFAGGDLAGAPRKIAGLAPENEWYQQCVSQFKAEVERLSNGAIQVTTFSYALDLGKLSDQAKSLIPQLESNGFTTIICGCDPIMPVFLSGEAGAQSYFPEFVTIGAALVDRDLVGQLYRGAFHTGHMFGVSALGDNAEEPPTQTIAYEAYKTVRPNDEPAFSVDLIYYQMYMLAIGIQMAGPNLTAETFAQGMFAYPDKFGPAGLWGFGEGDYTPQDDVREIYWDSNAVSPYNGSPGHWVNPQPGTRYPTRRGADRARPPSPGDARRGPVGP